MRQRGLDVSGLESILRAPLEALREVRNTPFNMVDGVEHMDGEAIRLAYDGMYGIEYHKALWSEEAARELDLTADAIGSKHSVGGGMRDVAKEIRGYLRSPWHTE